MLLSCMAKASMKIYAHTICCAFLERSFLFENFSVRTRMFFFQDLGTVSNMLLTRFRLSVLLYLTPNCRVHFS